MTMTLCPPIQDFRTQVREAIRPPIRKIITSPLGTAAESSRLISLTSTAGSTPVPEETNSITIPAGTDALWLWSGSYPAERFYLAVHISVDGLIRTFHLHRLDVLILRVAAGSVVSIGTQERLAHSFDPVDVTVPLVASLGILPTTLSDPTGPTESVPTDRNGPPTWAPTKPHLTLPAEGQTIQFAAASNRREVFLVEFDHEGTQTPIRHIHIPANSTPTVLCRHRKIALATYAGTPLSVTLPAGTINDGITESHQPEFVANNTRIISDVSDGFGGNQGSHALNLVAALTNPSLADGDDLVLSPGTYDLSTASAQINPTQFPAAMALSLRLRGSTGNPVDVILTGDGWRVVVAATKRWVIEGVTWNLAGKTPAIGGTGLVEFVGRVDLHQFQVIGPAATAGTPNLSYVGTSAGSPIENFASQGVIENSIEDGVDLSQPEGDLTVHLIDCVFNGNGSGASDQAVTAHNGSRVLLWGCRFTDQAQPTNTYRVVPDSQSSIYCLFCWNSTADSFQAEGFSFIVNGLYYCDLPTCSRAETGKGYNIGSSIRQKLNTTGFSPIPLTQATYYPLVLGSTIETANVSLCHGIDCRANAELIANLIILGGSSSQTGLRVDAGSPPAGSVVRTTNNRFLCQGTTVPISLGSNANISLAMINDVFDGSSTNYIISSTGATGSARHLYVRRSSPPNNWTTRFTTNVGNTFNGQAPDLDATGIPIDGGNCDDEGTDSLIYCNRDAAGAPLQLGGPIMRGSRAPGRLNTGQLLFPPVWIN